MKRKKLFLVLTLALALCLGLETPAISAETVVTTEEALRAALTNGGNVVLGSNIGTENKLVIKTNTDIDLNGHKLTVICKNSTEKAGIVISLGQTLTISDNKYRKTQSNDGKLYVTSNHTGIQTSNA